MEGSCFSPRARLRSSWDRITFYGKAEKAHDEPLKRIDPLPNVFDDEEVYVIAGRGWKARGKLTPHGFVVFAGSTCNGVCESFKEIKSYYPVRVQLEEDGIIVGGLFETDYLFKSAAQAACVIAGAPVNARRCWITEPDEDGQVMTFGEAHPKLHRSDKAPNAKRQAPTRKGIRSAARRVEREATRAEEREGVRIWKRNSGRWATEWRGQMPFHLEGTYMGVSCSR